MKTWRQSLLLSYSLIILAFLYLPIAVLVLYSFNNTRINAVWTGWTIQWYLSLFSNRHVLDAVSNSLIIAFSSTIISTLLGTMAALALHSCRFRWYTAINSLIYMPILIPEIVMGLSLLVLFAQLNIELGKITLVIAHITFCMSFVVIIISARLEGLSKDLEEAAQDLYANSWQTFRYVTLPLIMPGIIAGALISFTLSIDDFVISFFVAGPNSSTLPLYVYALVKRGISPEINALSTIMIIVTIVMVVISQRLQVNGSNKNNVYK